jgi:branched-chain amino acid transport system substrate-binding protein
VKSICSGQVQWAGVGLTMGLNAVAGPGCRANDSVDGAVFFSPFPGVDKAPSIDPQFAEAVKGKNWDDIYVALWGVSKAVGGLLEKTGKNLTRAGFVQTTENTKNFQPGLNPTLSFSPDNHFGAKQVHVLKADCDKGQYVTIGTFQTF